MLCGRHTGSGPHKALALVLVIGACSAPQTAVPKEVTARSATNASTTTTQPTTTTTQPTTTTHAHFEGAISGATGRLGHSWRDGCPVAPEQLSLLTVTHWGFDGQAHKGEIVIHAEQASPVLDLFEGLFDARYPIQSMIPIGDLPPDAETWPDYSNTSGFNCRFVAGTSRWSEHASGLAIDLNPHLNPLSDGDRVDPSGAARYVDRSLDEPGMIQPGDVVVRAFESIGWSWGGDWTSLKDYHHFSATGR